MEIHIGFISYSVQRVTNQPQFEAKPWILITALNLKNLEMKTISYIILILFTGAFINSCKKNDQPKPTVATLNIVNATLDAPNMALNFSPTGFRYGQNQTFVPDGSGLELGVASGASVVNLISSKDTSHTLYHGNLNLVSGKIYSLYVAGQAPDYQTVLMEDHLPVYADSTAGVRFISLSPDSPPLNISLQGNPGSDFSGMAYKTISDFKKYTATSGVVINGGYTFNVTDQSGNVLTTFNWVPRVFNRSNTLVITGSYNSGTVSVFQVNNF
jgi:Domain of unknown function (DUF4397)